MLIRRPFFTLLEILVVLSIIFFAVVLTGVKVKEMYKEQQFKSESQQVLSILSMAQDLMLIMDTDVLVRFAPNKEGNLIQVWLEVEKPIEPAWERLLKRKLSLKSIQSLEFDGVPVSDLTLQFSLGKMSKGKLALIEKGAKKDKKGEEFFAIQLFGYPSPLGSKREEDKWRSIEEKSEHLYPKQVYEELYQDPHKKSKKEK